MKRLTELALDDETPSILLPKVLAALSVQGQARMQILEDILRDLVENATSLRQSTRDDIIGVLREEYRAAKAISVLSDEPQEPQEQKNSKWMTSKQLRELQDLLRPPVTFSPPKWPDFTVQTVWSDKTY